MTKPGRYTSSMGTSGAGDEKRYWNGTEMGFLAHRVKVGSDPLVDAARLAPRVPPARPARPARLARAA